MKVKLQRLGCKLEGSACAWAFLPQGAGGVRGAVSSSLGSGGPGAGRRGLPLLLAPSGARLPHLAGTQLQEWEFSPFPVFGVWCSGNILLWLRAGWKIQG